MKLTDVQAMQLLTVLHDSVKKNVLGIFSYDINDRVQLYDDIVNQQNTNLKEYKDDDTDNISKG